MPILNKNYTLEITPEQFLNACSRNELIETGLLLDSPGIQRKVAQDDIQDSNYVSAEVGNQAHTMFKSDSLEAEKILFEITSKSRLQYLEVIALMPLFQKLERLRIKSLVRCPQHLPINTEE